MERAGFRTAATIADGWRAERGERLKRTALDRADFAALAEGGYLGLAVPTDQGGAWTSPAGSTRGIAGALRTLAAGDASPALVAAMHPAVLSFWLANPVDGADEWEAQRRAVFATAADGAQWGTVTSEPGSGGDVARTSTVARPADEGAVDVEIPGRRYHLSGDKHFGSGTGVCSYMITTAVPDGEDEASAFFLDTRALTTDDHLDGFTVVGEWDGIGMAATQSHAVRLDGCPAIRLEYPGPFAELLFGAAPVNLAVFTGVVLGIVDEAMADASARLAPRSADLRAYEQVEWSRASAEHWLMEQAFEGMLRAIEDGDRTEALRAAQRGKVSAAELAESVLGRVARTVGGGTFSRRSPFAAWYEDVRALGFLRPPWGLAFDGIYATSF